MLTFSLPLLRAQSVEEIQNSKEYIWGTGNASTLKKADNEALAALISQISTNVSSQFSQLTEGGTDGDKATVDETFKSVINTYSRSTFRYHSKVSGGSSLPVSKKCFTSRKIHGRPMLPRPIMMASTP